MSSATKRSLSDSEGTPDGDVSKRSKADATLEEDDESGENGEISNGMRRAISACRRCRSRKTKCDKQFPSCSKCIKAGVKCVGTDAATGREVPRSYVSFLESRILNLESELKKLGHAPPPTSTASPGSSVGGMDGNPEVDRGIRPSEESDLNHEVDGIMRKVGMVSVSGGAATKESSYLGATAGLTFARILFSAVRLKQNDVKVVTPVPADIKPSLLPPKDVAERLISLFFSQANAQLPILHREQFVKAYFEPVYGKLSTGVSLASDHTKIGLERSDEYDDNCYYNINSHKQQKENESPLGEPNKCLYFLNMVFGIATSILHQQNPTHLSESYRLTAAHHFDVVFSSSNRLEALQGLLLLSLYSLMRPAVPGVWYVLGTSIRVCIDLGLHNEERKPLTSNDMGNNFTGEKSSFDPATLDMRRRLFWCTYALDRQVSVYLGRPFGIPEESIKAQFPSELDDAYILPEGLIDCPGPSYKTISLAFFKIRKIQTEIQRILYENAELPRKYNDIGEWKQAIVNELEQWHKSCPKSAKKMNCKFNLLFFELNYHQTRLLLFGLNPYNRNPSTETLMIIADAGANVIKKYRELNRSRTSNYTWVAVQNLFMAGTSYLYSLYHSPEVRAATTMEEIEFNSLACIHVLDSLIDRCDAAASCKSSFELLSAAIMKLCYNEQKGITISFDRQIKEKIRGGPKFSDLIENLPTDNQMVSNIKRKPKKPKVKKETNGISNGRTDGGADGGTNDISSNDINDNVVSTNTNEDHSEVPLQSPDDLRSIDSDDAQWHLWPEDLKLCLQEAAQLEDDVINQGWNNNPETNNLEPIANGQNVIMGPLRRGEPDDEFNRRPEQAYEQVRNGPDGRIVYEMMNEVPLSSIWDQFIAVPGSTPTQSGYNPNMTWWDQ